MSTIPINVEKMLNYSSQDCRSDRALNRQISSLAEDDRKSEAPKRDKKPNKNIRDLAATKSQNINGSTPHSNLSYATLKSLESSQNNNGSKVYNQLTSQQAKIVSVNQPKNTQFQSNKLHISSNILNNIRKKQQNQLPLGNPRLTDSSRVSQQTPSKDTNGKLFNIALKSAKNVNMFEINNYFNSNSNKDDESSVSNTSSFAKSVASKRLQSKVKELAKAKVTSPKDTEILRTTHPKESNEPRPSTSLQNKLQSINNYSSKNRLNLNANIK